MSTRNRKVRLDKWWLNWISTKASETPLKYETDGIHWVGVRAVEILQALEAALLEHGVEAPFEIDLPKKKAHKDE